MRQIITLKDDWFFAKNKQEQIPQILPENWERVLTAPYLELPGRPRRRQ